MQRHAARHGVPLHAAIISTLVFLTCLSTAPGYATSSTTMTVNSRADPGSVGDMMLTLREALRLANGTLSWSALEPAEQAQVTCSAPPCTPGAASTDTIRFDPMVFPVDAPAWITLTTALPPLSGGGDMLDASGAGVILDGLLAGPDVSGLVISSGSNGNTIRGLQIVRFSGYGILVRGNTNRIEGNLVGLTWANVPEYGNIEAGIRIEAGAQGNVVGGTSAETRNVISGNGRSPGGSSPAAGHGLWISGASDNQIIGNYIGMNRDQTGSLGNLRAGILVDAGSQRNQIGGSNAGEGNLIVGNNASGIEIAGEGTAGQIVQGNTISGNGSDGLRLKSGAQQNTIGGNATGARNVITGNAGAGLFVRDSTTIYNLLARNLSYGNVGLGIDLAPFGVTLNDPEDLDTGPNELLNFPDFFSPATQAQIQGSACSGCVIELYKASGPGNGQGLFFVTATNADVRGVFTFTQPGLAYGTWVSATATDSHGNTSEFATNIQVGGHRTCSQPFPQFPDFTGEGNIDARDLLFVTARWQARQPDPPYLDDFDLDGDGVISIKDIQAVAKHWAEVCSE